MTYRLERGVRGRMMNLKLHCLQNAISWLKFNNQKHKDYEYLLWSTGGKIA